MPNPLLEYWWTLKGVGLDNVPRRLLQAARVKSGWLRRRTDPALDTDEAFRKVYPHDVSGERERWETRRKRLLPVPSPDALRQVAGDATWDEHVIAVCEKALAGEYRFFGRWYGRLGWPPDFNRDPVHEITWPVDQHWTETARSGPPRHDIKLVWEPSRFTLAYDLARAYARNGDDRWAEAYWVMFDAWIEQNPPQMSVAWGCGQEISFRMMAMLAAACATLESHAATDERLLRLTRLVWQFARRIAVNINYAQSQENNHGLSEAVGLWTAGLVLPELPGAASWRLRGERVLVNELARQVYADGSYVQHSVNYHRVMLDDVLWYLSLSRRRGETVPQAVEDAFGRASGWLKQMTDPDTGRAPLYGANDGASVLPLECADYLDMRPTLQAAHWWTDRARLYPPGPWDEKALWLWGTETLDAPHREADQSSRESVALSSGGYIILRGPQSRLVTRCHRYRDRPSQADMLHVDLWFRGHNVLRDAGSYLYYDEEPWKLWFKSIAAHNTVQIDGEDQMIHGPRFLWFRWVNGRLIESSFGGRDGEDSVVMEHDGYTRLPGSPTHRRELVRQGDCFAITDVLTTSGQHEAVLRWRLMPAPWEAAGDGSWRTEIDGSPWAIRLLLPDAFSVELVEGVEGSSPEGWESLYYGEKATCPTLLVRGRFASETKLVTIVGPAGMMQSISDGL